MSFRLVGSLVSAGQVKEEDHDSIVEAIMKREELGSTGIGRGVAVPHTKHSSVESLIGTVGVSAEGVEFDSLDGEPVLIAQVIRMRCCFYWYRILIAHG